MWSSPGSLDPRRPPALRQVEARERAAGFGAEDQFEKRDAVERRSPGERGDSAGVQGGSWCVVERFR